MKCVTIYYSLTVRILFSSIFFHCIRYIQQIKYYLFPHSYFLVIKCSWKYYIQINMPFEKEHNIIYMYYCTTSNIFWQSINKIFFLVCTVFWQFYFNSNSCYPINILVFHFNYFQNDIFLEIIILLWRSSTRCIILFLVEPKTTNHVIFFGDDWIAQLCSRDVNNNML